MKDITVIDDFFNKKELSILVNNLDKINYKSDENESGNYGFGHDFNPDKTNTWLFDKIKNTFIKNNNFEGKTQELSKTKIGKDMLNNARRHYEESLERGVSPFNNFYTYDNPLGLMNFEQNNNQNLLNMPLIPPVNSIIKKKIKKKKRKRKND